MRFGTLAASLLGSLGGGSLGGQLLGQSGSVIGSILGSIVAGTAASSAGQALGGQGLGGQGLGGQGQGGGLGNLLGGLLASHEAQAGGVAPAANLAATNPIPDLDESHSEILVRAHVRRSQE